MCFSVQYYVMSNKKYCYRTYPPFIDAYESDYNGNTSLEGAKRIAINHAIMWGEQSIGQAVLRTGDPPKFDGHLVVGCLSVWKDTKNFSIKTFLVVVDNNMIGDYWFEKLKVIEAPIDDDWNVT